MLYCIIMPGRMQSFKAAFIRTYKQCLPIHNQNIILRHPHTAVSALKSSESPDSASTTPFSTSSPSSTSSSEGMTDIQPLVHKCEGLCAVHKPIDWTSQDVVSYIRGMLERDARNRGVTLAKRSRRKSKKKIKVGHGGTLDPLAEGVLVLGIGSGTKVLKDYLSGAKAYQAKGKFGFETTTLDLEGNVTKTADFDHITHESVENSCTKFTGKIMQIPPVFSAIRKNGKRLYEHAREGKSADDVEIDPREVEVHELIYSPDKEEGLPSFELFIKCGGGTYIRSLIRDIGYDLDSVATMTKLIRTQQGPFTLDDAMQREDWSADTIYAAVERNNQRLAAYGQEIDDGIVEGKSEKNHDA